MRPAGTFHRLGNAGRHDAGGVIIAIHGLRRINGIDPTSRVNGLLISLKIARIAGKILASGELCRVDINADNDAPRGLSGGVDQRQMPGMD